MQSKNAQLYAVSVAIAAGLFLAWLALNSYWPELRWHEEPFHSTVEALGALAAVCMAFVLLQRPKPEPGGVHRSLLAAGFLGMGLLDGFHAVMSPGQGFVFLHSIAALVGGFWFALIWLPDVGAYVSDNKWVPWVVSLGSVACGLWVLAAPEQLPRMVDSGEFTSAAMTINLLAGGLFVVAAVRLFWESRRTAEIEPYLLGGLALLFGLAELLFKFSALWDGEWWLWHVIRLMAYLITLGLVVRTYQQTHADLRTADAERRQAAKQLRQSEERFRTMADFAFDWEYWYDPKGRFVYVSPSCEQMTGYRAEAFLEDPSLIETIVHPDDRTAVTQHHRRHTEEEGALSLDFRIISRGGQQRWVEHVCQPVTGADGRWLGRRATNRDITARKQAEETIARQAQEILEVSTPVMQVWEGVLVAPLIGSLDTERAERFMEVLLDRLVATKSSVALVDLTGVPVVDTHTATFLIETIKAARLLGAKTMLTGVSPSIAQTLVHLGIDMAGFETRASLAAGLRDSLEIIADGARSRAP
jgi:PAS domain S-box-containing protein